MPLGIYRPGSAFFSDNAKLLWAHRRKERKCRQRFSKWLKATAARSWDPGRNDVTTGTYDPASTILGAATQEKI
jgi:hypothetical protein